MLRILRAACQ